MFNEAVLALIVAGGVACTIYAQSTPVAGAIPSDSFEIVTGQVSAVDAAGRAEALRLLDRARSSYALHSTGRAYDLKVTFTVKSGGQTAHDGTWEMEDIFDPKQGLRWTAKAPDAYAITRISRNGMLYGEDTGSYVPLRLHEARAALFDPIPSKETANRASIRTSTAIYQGMALTCILLSGRDSGAPAANGRRWDETEECIDPQSGLLQTHSQVPGRYFVYDYTNGPQLAGRVLAGKVTVAEGGRAVTTIAAESLQELPSVDASLFAPTGEMKSRGRPIGLGGAQKIPQNFGQSPTGPSARAEMVCVFGVVTPSGQLMEAHSLQPSNPNSVAAIEAAKQMSFTRAAPAGAQPQQYFVFVFEKFAGAQ